VTFASAMNLPVEPTNVLSVSIFVRPCVRMIVNDSHAAVEIVTVELPSRCHVALRSLTRVVMLRGRGA